VGSARHLYTRWFLFECSEPLPHGVGSRCRTCSICYKKTYK
jgi:hypothetical protein